MNDDGQVRLWECPDCAFAFDASHRLQDGTYSCPVCAEAALQTENDRLRAVADAAREYRDAVQVCGIEPREHVTLDEARAEVAAGKRLDALLAQLDERPVIGADRESLRPGEVLVRFPESGKVGAIHEETQMFRWLADPAPAACRHIEHAVTSDGGGGAQRVGRFFVDDSDSAGTWEPCSVPMSAEVSITRQAERYERMLRGRRAGKPLCALCGKAATGFAGQLTGSSEVRLCHGDEDERPTCYERWSRGERPAPADKIPTVEAIAYAIFDNCPEMNSRDDADAAAAAVLRLISERSEE